MQTIWIITKRELASFFDSLIAYIMLILFLGISGFFTWLFGSDIFLFVGPCRKDQLKIPERIAGRLLFPSYFSTRTPWRAFLCRRRGIVWGYPFQDQER